LKRKFANIIILLLPGIAK